jgi:hypothetical protein
MQLDKSTDVTCLSALLAFVRYIYNNQVEEEMPICKRLPTHTTGEDIFNLTDLYISGKDLRWNQCVDICTDSAQSMVGKTKGFIAHVSHCTRMHCIIHCLVLAVKKIPNELKMVLYEVVKIVNFIKSSPLNSRNFQCTLS